MITDDTELEQQVIQNAATLSEAEMWRRLKQLEQYTWDMDQPDLLEAVIAITAKYKKIKTKYRKRINDTVI